MACGGRSLQDLPAQSDVWHAEKALFIFCTLGRPQVFAICDVIRSIKLFHTARARPQSVERFKLDQEKHQVQEDRNAFFAPVQLDFLNLIVIFKLLPPSH